MARKADDAKLLELQPGEQSLGMAVRHAGYDVTVREVCRALMCSRQFVADHVRTSARHIYVSARWARATGLVGFAGGQLYSRPELDDVARRARVEVRTVPVWVETMVEDPSALADARTSWAHAHEFGDPARLREMARDAVAYELEHGCKDEWRDALGFVREHGARRSKAEWVKVPEREWVEIPGHSLRMMVENDWAPRPSGLADLGSKWRTLADLMGYGDTQEEWQREVWGRCVVRCVVGVGGAERVMYGPSLVAPDPEGADARSIADGLGLVRVPLSLVPDGYVATLGQRHGWWDRLMM